MTQNKYNHQYILGIDVGTTTVKVALVDRDTHQVTRTLSRETQGNIHSDQGSIGSEQDAQKIVSAVRLCVSGLPKELLLHVEKIGISGQMHGIMYWKSKGAWKLNSVGRHELGDVSQLFTWQDGRCSPEFIQSLPKPDSHLKLASGLGCCTTFWIQRNKALFLDHYNCAGTIQDFLVAMLCNLDKPVMSVQNAASWGYMDTSSKKWNTEILESAKFPLHLLPEICDPGVVVGKLAFSWYGIPKGTPVGAALGDLQCSILPRLKGSQNAVLNISTSAQLAFQMHENFQPPALDTHSAIEYFPYFNGRYLAVAASLNGGNVMAAFVKMLQQWTHEFGRGVPESDIWNRLLALAQDPDSRSDLDITSTLFGERHCPRKHAQVLNITMNNISLGSVFYSLCKGLISNLHSMMSQDCLHAAGIQQIVGSGTALVKNSVIREQIEEQYKLPLVLSEESHADAAIGAALAMV